MAQYSYPRLKPSYTQQWASMRVTAGERAVAQAKRIIWNKERYKKVEARTGVPWFVIGCLHMRESNCDFNRWLHNGDKMRNREGKPIRTRQVPAGRPPNPNVSWEDGAVDAMQYQGLCDIEEWCPEFVAYGTEKFNGWGYRRPKINVPSPYLWGGTSIQKPGKYVADHVFARVDKQGKPLYDTQLGVMALLRVLMELDPEIAFKDVTVKVTEPTPAEDEDYEEQPYSPKAIETEEAETPHVASLMRTSETVRGALLGYGTSIAGLFTAFLEKLHDPVNLFLFVLFILLASGALYMVLKGRINVQKLVAHLADDNTE